MSDIRIRWEKDQDLPFPGEDPSKGKHRAIVIRHGGTYYFYLDLSREEAERRFRADMEDRSEILALAEAEQDQDVLGVEIGPFDDQFVLWTSMGQDVQKIADMIFGGIIGGDEQK